MEGRGEVLGVRTRERGRQEVRRGLVAWTREKGKRELRNRDGERERRGGSRGIDKGVKEREDSVSRGLERMLGKTR